MYYKQVKGGALVSVKVIAGAKKNEIAGVRGDFLVVKVTAHREKGRGNEALITFFSKAFACSKKDIRIVKGETQSRKLVFLPISCERLAQQH